ncbi:hypothetical protein MJD09_11850 [bacterium]|nr:hypothetical protein [bacterium]
MLKDPAAATNVLQFEEVARNKLKSDAYSFLSAGADDMKTLRANDEAFN